VDTTPLPRPDDDPFESQPRRVGTGCRRGHTGRSGPGENRELGQVPGRISAWFGAVVLALICAAVWIWLPGVRPWLLAGLGTWYVVTFAIQAALGHRGTCLVRRAGRWFFGPAGALLDPSED
jgi:hypothetical protein